MKHTLLIATILIVTFVSLSPVLNNHFTNWDDHIVLTNNERVRTLAANNVKEIFTTTIQQLYIPLTILSFAVEYHFFGYDPFIYHLNNLLLHLSVIGLIYIFALRIGLSTLAAAVAALIFGIHPMHVESVAWVTERKDVLYALFYLLALINYWRYLETGRKLPYTLSLIFGLLSILAKPMALSLPLILLLCDWFFKRKRSWNMWLDKIPFLLYIIPIATITFLIHSEFLLTSNMGGGLVWIWTFVFYLKKFIAPIILVPLYHLPYPASLAHLQYSLSVGGFILLIFLIFRFRRSALLKKALPYWALRLIDLL